MPHFDHLIEDIRHRWRIPRFDWPWFPLPNSSLVAQIDVTHLAYALPPDMRRGLFDDHQILVTRLYHGRNESPADRELRQQRLGHLCAGSRDCSPVVALQVWIAEAAGAP